VVDALVAVSYNPDDKIVARVVWDVQLLFGFKATQDEACTTLPASQLEHHAAGCLFALPGSFTVTWRLLCALHFPQLAAATPEELKDGHVLWCTWARGQKGRSALSNQDTARRGTVRFTVGAIVSSGWHWPQSLVDFVGSFSEKYRALFGQPTKWDDALVEWIMLESPARRAMDSQVRKLCAPP
jgi:hypothetical protein